MEWKLELVPIPVSDVDAAKHFYTEKLGFTLDHDVSPNPQFRVVQLTPPGSACSICFGVGIVKTPPGSVQGLHLVVPDIHAARAQLVERGVQASEIQERGAGIFFVFFKDPDGNSWAVQHIAPEARTSKGDKP
jgi:catechol 2,3-dioxygenase-like lactoylglutathione lyase family enzyme